MNTIVINGSTGQYTFQRDAMSKSQAASAGLVAVPCVRLVQKGKSEMSETERYFAGNAAFGMVAEPSTLYCDPATKEQIRKSLAGTGDDAAIVFEAGRASEAAILKCLGATEGEGERRDQFGNMEPLRKGEESIFGGTPSLLTKGGGAALVRKAYGEWMNADGTADLKKATAELDELVRNLEAR